MTSAINTNNIDVNYPIPGQDNDSQGFRDNFFNIRSGLDTASQEITNLQTSFTAVAFLVKSTDPMPEGWEGTGHYLPVVDASGVAVPSVKYQIVKKTV